MPYYFDRWGWLTEEVLPGRATETPAPDNIPEGHQANWTGHVWKVMPYIPPLVEQPPAAPPVTRRQLRLALHRTGRLSAIENWVGLQDAELKIYWNDTTEFHKDHPVIVDAAIRFGLTTADIDAIWAEAMGA